MIVNNKKVAISHFLLITRIAGENSFMIFKVNNFNKKTTRTINTDNLALVFMEDFRLFSENFRLFLKKKYKKQLVTETIIST